MKRITPETRRKYMTLRESGHERAEAARRCRVSYSWAKGFDRGLVTNHEGQQTRPIEEAWLPQGQVERGAGPVPLDELCDEAKRALDDIAYFALRYFGLLLVPAQVDAVEKALVWAETDDEEYVVVNQPPGSGKTTLWATVVPAWITCKKRHIRGLIGSASESLAKLYIGRLRDVLTTTEPIKASPAAVKAGIAIDAEAALCIDFGRFRPDDNTMTWASTGFVVEQHDGRSFGQKELTWIAFGRESSFIGVRVDIAIWDDVYDPGKMRSADIRAELKRWWADVAEQRLEPGGLLILQGQRLDPDDIYRHALDETEVEIDEESGEQLPGGKPKYHHVIYKAHYDEHCHGLHKRTDPPYDPKRSDDSGCLLYPRRLPWAKLCREKENNANYEVIYNQDDTAHSQMLVPRLWIVGGIDKGGEVRPGCQDLDRGLCEIPRGLAGDLVSICTADPSPTRFWSIQWWAVRWDASLGEFVERYLLDHIRDPMGANDLLDWNAREGRFSGVMEEWQTRSIELHLPISHWVIENNAAQRFLFQYDHFHRWVAHRGVDVIQHETYKNKADPKLGVTSIASHYKYGRYRLPYAREARVASEKLASEVVQYPFGRTDDCMMAQWFLEWTLPYLQFDEDAVASAWRPSWLAGSPSTLAEVVA